MSYRIIHPIFPGEPAFGELREYEPFKRSICYSGRLYYVQFPYTLFRWVHGSLRIGFLKHQLNSWDDLVYCPPLNNIYDEFRVCGCDSNDINEAIDLFWTKSFTDDGERGHIALRCMFTSFWDVFRRGGSRSVDKSTRYERWRNLSKKKKSVALLTKQLCLPIDLHTFSELWERNVNFKAPYEDAMKKHIKLMQEEGVL